MGLAGSMGRMVRELQGLDGRRMEPGQRADMECASRPEATIARLLQAGVLMLPLLWWGGLENAFATPKMFLLAGLDVVVGLHLIFGRQKRLVLALAGEWPWLMWLGAVALSALFGRYVSLEALLLTLLPLPLVWALLGGVPPANRLVQGLVWVSAAESVIAILQYCRLDPLSLLWRPDLSGSSRMRVYGTLGNPDFVAAWLCATLPLYSSVPATRRKRLLWSAALVLQLGAIMATGSRLFLIALPVIAVVLLLRRGGRAKWCLAGLPLAVAMLWFSPARPLDVTVRGRLYLANVAVSQWRQIPVLGYGPGAFRLQFVPWQAEWLRQHNHDAGARQFAGPVDHAHNDYLEFLVEYGPAGLCAFLVLSGWLMYRAWRVRPESGAAGVAGVWAGLATLLAIALVDFPFHRPAEWALYWVLLGVLGSGVHGPLPAQEHGETK